jgi:hypothetical protein
MQPLLTGPVACTSRPSPAAGECLDFEPPSYIKVPPTIPPAGLFLPYVEQSVLNNVADRGKFIELHEFHPDNTYTNVIPTLNTHVSLDPNNPGIATFSTSSRKKHVDTFEAWVECFSAYAAHKSYYFPDQAIPLFNYMRHIAKKAAVYQTTAWMPYDKSYRQDAARYHGERNWSLPNHELEYQYFNQNSHRMFRRVDVQQGNTRGSWVDNRQPVRQETGSSHWDKQQICRDYNRGRCLNPCQYGRLHACNVCFNANHTASFHSTTSNQASSQFRNDTSQRTQQQR